MYKFDEEWRDSFRLCCRPYFRFGCYISSEAIFVGRVDLGGCRTVYPVSFDNFDTCLFEDRGSPLFVSL